MLNFLCRRHDFPLPTRKPYSPVIVIFLYVFIFSLHLGSRRRRTPGLRREGIGGGGACLHVKFSQATSEQRKKKKRRYGRMREMGEDEVGKLFFCFLPSPAPTSPVYRGIYQKNYVRHRRRGGGIRLSPEPERRWRRAAHPG